MGGRRRREAATGREGKGGGRRRAEAGRSSELGPAEAAGADAVRPLPARAPETPTPGFAASPPPSSGRCTLAPLGLRQSLERLKLGSRDAQPIRKGAEGSWGGGWNPLFPPSPKSAPAGQAGPLPGRPGWWVGGKHRPSGGGNRGSCFLTLPPHLPKALPRWRLLPCLGSPIPCKLLGARAGKPGRKTSDLGRATSLFSPSLPTLLPRCVCGARCGERFTRVGFGPATAPQEGALPLPHSERYQWPLPVASGPLAAPPPELCGECGFAEERAGGRRARILHPSTPLPFKEDPLEGGNPGRTSCPGLVAGRKADAAGTSQSRRGLGGALAVRRAELGPHTPRPWGCKGSAVTWWGLQATSFHGGVGRGKREKSKWIKEEMESPGRG